MSPRTMAEDMRYIETVPRGSTEEAHKAALYVADRLAGDPVGVCEVLDALGLRERLQDGQR